MFPDGDDDASFGWAVQLVQNDAGTLGRFGEAFGLPKVVLADGGIEDQQLFVRGGGDLLGNGLLLNVFFCRKAPKPWHAGCRSNGSLSIWTF